MIESVLKIGGETGFSTIEAFREKIDKQEFADHIDNGVSRHTIQTDRVSVRAFWETDEPVGFHLSKPDAKSIKAAFANIYAVKLSGQKKNYAALLPETAKKVKLDIFDSAGDAPAGDNFVDLLDRVNESVIQFPGLKIKKMRFTKILKKVYLANSKGLDIKYRKTYFNLDLGFLLGNNRIDIGESKIFFHQLEPFKTVSRAFNFLNSLTASGPGVTGNCYFILSPEASAFILKEFSDHFRLDGEKEKSDIRFPAIINIVDDPLLDGQVGSVPFDDEGVQGRERDMIRKGAQAGFISNIQAAFENKTVSSGNGFRSERALFPAVRFSNLYIKPTVLSLNNLLKDAGRGILVSLLKLKSIGNDNKYVFSAYGYRFENEEICEPVHFYFRTSFLSYFLNILKVSKELRFFAGVYNIGSPYIMLEASGKSSNMFEI